jgi:hypothetical protein
VGRRLGGGAGLCHLDRERMVEHVRPGLGFRRDRDRRRMCANLRVQPTTISEWKFPGLRPRHRACPQSPV